MVTEYAFFIWDHILFLKLTHDFLLVCYIVKTWSGWTASDKEHPAECFCGHLDILKTRIALHSTAQQCSAVREGGGFL